jgi:hypothetical protein
MLSFAERPAAESKAGLGRTRGIQTFIVTVSQRAG